MDKGLQLINLVKSYEFLYNLDSPLYNNTLKKEDTWNKIGEQLNLSGILLFPMHVHNPINNFANFV